MQGEDRSFQVRRRVPSGFDVDLHVVDEEEAAADSVVAARVWFVAIVAEAEPPSFRLLLGGQALDRVVPPGRRLEREVEIR
jgi:hypothetical protein